MGWGNKEKVETYDASLICKNCNHEVDVEIPKGTSITMFIKDGNSECPECGCKTLVKEEDY